MNKNLGPNKCNLYFFFLPFLVLRAFTLKVSKNLAFNILRERERGEWNLNFEKLRINKT